MRWARLAVACVACATLSACAGPPPPRALPARPYSPPDERIVLFSSGSAEIASAEGFFALGYVVALLDAEPGYHALIVGYADARGNAGYNHDLCFRRARAVRKVLLEHGIQDKRILIGAPREQEGSADAQFRRRADVFVYDPLRDEVSKRLGYEVELRAE